MNTPSRPPRVLLVDDDATQLKLTRLRLSAAGYDVTLATSADEAIGLARTNAPDAIVSDVLMSDMDGFGLCRLVRAEPSLASVPVILLSAHYHEAPDQKLAARVGASALVARTPDFDAELAALRQSLGASPPGVAVSDAAVYEEHLRTNASKLARLAGHARNAEERYRKLWDSANDTISVLSTDGVILEANERWRDVLGIPPDQLVGRHIGEFASPGHEGRNLQGYRRSIEGGRGEADAVALRGANGTTVFMSFSSSLIQTAEGQLVFSIGRDVTEQVLAAERLAEAEQKYRSLVERIPDVIWTATLDGRFRFCTSNVEHLLGFTADEMCGQDLDERASYVHPDDRKHFLDAFSALARDDVHFDIEYRRRRKDGQYVWLRNRTTASYELRGVRYVEGMISDVSERRRLEETLRQSQKMEAIGLLTGGIAHDFNNILAVILANCHFLTEGFREDDPNRADAVEIKIAAEKGAALVRQLLAFSRRQVLEPTTVDLNEAVGGLERMLRRVIGEDITLSFAAGSGLGAVRVDSAQLEQVIMNLVVNARDAMPNGGRVTLETAAAELDAEAAAQIGGVPGRYVVLSVSDSGCGMSAETKRRIFEPFFTTKGVGKGTGLGLSTCYGIIKQSGGHIWVYSEPGLGTVFRIYLPCVDQAPAEPRPPAHVGNLNGTETVLVIEDDEGFRNAVIRMLRGHGYTLLVARNTGEAASVAERHEGRIDLVLSDVVMPGGNGPDFIDQLKSSRAVGKTLFMSGYTDHPAFRDGAVGSGVNFIQKPFAPDSLAKKVREVLDA